MVHSLAHARAAASAATDAGRAITIASAPGAGAYAGGAWFAEVIAQARTAYPDAQFDAILDCADAAGWTLAAIRAGVVDAVRVSTRPALVRKLRAIAGKTRIVTVGDDEALDLRDVEDAAAACRDWIEARSRPA